MTFGLSITQRGGAALERRLARAAANVPGELARRVERATILTQSDLKRNGMTGKKGSHPLFGVTGPDPASGTVGARTGLTRASVTSRTFSVGNTYTGVVGSPLAHVKTLEEGGTQIGHPWLRIPLRAAQTPAGVDRNAGRSVRGQNFFRWPNRRQRAGALARIKGIYLAKADGGVLALWYLLVHQTRRKARRVFRRTADRVRPRVTAMLRVPFRLFRAGD